MSERRVLLRAKSGATIGLGHLMRTRAVAEEIVRRAGAPLFVVDDEACARALEGDGFEACSVLQRPDWALEPASGAWIDGFGVDWTAELRALLCTRTPSYLVENRRSARVWANYVVQPKLHVDPVDVWERQHEARILRGPAWVPLSVEVRAQRPAEVRDVDLLVTFGGSDPLCSTERVLLALPQGARVAVSVGPFMEERRPAIERAAARLAGTVLPAGAALAPWMARARCAITALGTTLYELAYLRTNALILANYDEDRPVLDFYRRHGPFRPLGLAHELDERALGRALERALGACREPGPEVPRLGDGAARLAERLLERATRTALAP